MIPSKQLSKLAAMSVPAATPVLPLTRALFVLGVCLTAGTGFALYAFPDRTADYWAWTIAAEPSAASFGAGYLGAGVALTLGALTREWRRARVVVVLVFALTSLALVVTMLDFEPFAIGEGGLTEAVAWTWLVVYVALPPLALAAFVLQERAGGAGEYDVAVPMLRWTQLLLGGAAAVVGVLGVGLLVDWGWLAERWPWPLTPLTARFIGAWLVTYAAGFLWCVLRERDWRRTRIAVPPAATTTALLLVSFIWLHDRFDDGASTPLYVALFGALLLAMVVAAVVEERRMRESEPVRQVLARARGAPGVDP
jgi:hypothetical protein